MRSRSHPRPIVAAFAVALAALPASVSARPWALSDLYAAATIDGVEAAPSGALLFARQYADVGRDRFAEDYEIRDPDGGVRRIAAGFDVAEAHWSPSGDAVAFAAADAKGVQQLFLVAASGGTPRPLTSGARAVERFSWSPDGRSIAAVETLERKDAPAPRSFWFDPDNDVLAGTPAVRELWLLDARSGAGRRIVTDGASYGGPATDHDPAWSPDGTHLAVVRQPTPLYADFERQEAVGVDVRTGAVMPLADGPSFALPQAAPPAYSRRGHVVTVHTWDGTFAARQDLYVDGRDVSAPLDRDFWSCGNSRTAWSGDALLATAMDGTAMRLYRFAPNGPPEALTPPDGSVEAFAPEGNGGAIVAYSTPAKPAELYRLGANGTLAQLTHVDALPAGLDVASTVDVHWTNAAGRTLVGQLTSGASDRAMTIAELHGGPQCADDSSFNPYVQYFATNGYAYFRPSPRGSDGYGDWSYKAIVDDWGPGPMDDVMRGVDALVAARHLDPERLFLYGASYGGYLTTWTIGHTTRFHAAVAGVPVTDLTLDYTLSESPNITRRFFGKRPTADDAAQLLEQSPLHVAAAVRTPLLIFTGLRDTRAPYPQAIEYYKVLHERGNDVRLLAYPAAGHGPDDPLGTSDWFAHLAGWFAAHDGLELPGAIRP